MNDEIITALRATKEKLAQDAGFDITRLIKCIQQEEAASAAQGRLVLQPPQGSPASDGFQKIRFSRN